MLDVIDKINHDCSIRVVTALLECVDLMLQDIGHKVEGMRKKDGEGG